MQTKRVVEIHAGFSRGTKEAMLGCIDLARQAGIQQGRYFGWLENIVPAEEAYTEHELADPGVMCTRIVTSLDQAVEMAISLYELCVLHGIKGWNVEIEERITRSSPEFSGDLEAALAPFFTKVKGGAPTYEAHASVVTGVAEPLRINWFQERFSELGFVLGQMSSFINPANPDRAVQVGTVWTPDRDTTLRFGEAIKPFRKDWAINNLFIEQVHGVFFPVL